jgi:Ni,Fe-hydrogenase III small subunit/formate hydrogenlyase subunit 6/NADH:ubiquinone oxidoreductase subunit I
MLKVIQARWQQGYRTIRYPDGPPPDLPERFAGRPEVEASKCSADCNVCAEACPTQAIRPNPAQHEIHLDTGRCIFCRACERACGSGAIAFSREFRMAASQREDLIVSDNRSVSRINIDNTLKHILGRSLKLRQVSAGGCNACEADTNVLNTVGWDMGRFGIQFVASPRHADGLLVTGPVTDNMKLALEKTYHAVPSPKIVIAVGACAISGGPYVDHPEVNNGAASVVPVDVFVPGCPPHPLTILNALLAVVGRLDHVSL